MDDVSCPAAPVKVVSDALGYGQAEVELCRFVESAAQAVVVDRRLSDDGAHDRYQGFPQRGKQAVHRRRRHAFICDIDQRVSDVSIGREKVRILAAKIDSLFEERPHGGEVVCRPGARPSIIRGGPERAGARDIFCANFDRPFEVASRHAYQARVVRISGEGVGMGLGRVEQLTEVRVDRLFVYELADSGALAGPCNGPVFRHVGGVIPAEQRPRGPEIVHLEQAALEFRQLGFGRLSVAQDSAGLARPCPCVNAHLGAADTFGGCQLESPRLNLSPRPWHRWAVTLSRMCCDARPGPRRQSTTAMSRWCSSVRVDCAGGKCLVMRACS